MEHVIDFALLTSTKRIQKYFSVDINYRWTGNEYQH